MTPACCRGLSRPSTLGTFPGKNVSPQQKLNLVKLALFYQLDPLAGEIMHNLWECASRDD